MSRDSVSPNASHLKGEAVTLIKPWLMGESKYQFSKNEITHQAHPASSRDYILSTEIPNKWHRFQLFREISKAEINETALKLQVGQNVLKACAAARAAYIWDEVARGQDTAMAHGKSWVELDKYVDGLRKNTRRLPGYDLLDRKNVHDAVDGYAGKPGAYRHPLAAYIGMVGLGLSAVIEQTTLGRASNKELVFPAPGLPSGELTEWKAE